MRRLLPFSLVLALSAAVLAPAAVGSAPACAAETSGSPHAALVVGTGGTATTYCVVLDSSTVSGIHLIQLAGSQFGLQYRLGFGGQAVCQLAGVGPSGGDCFADYPDFWGYWHGDGHGSWSWAGSGAASASIGDGDMEGWVYGSGDSGTTHAAPPALAFDDVCEDATPSPTPTPTPPPGGGGDGGGSGGNGSGNGSGNGAGTDRDPTGGGTSADREDGGLPSNPGNENRDRSEGGDREPSPAAAATSTITSATPITALAGGVTDEASGGPPLGALFAVIAVAVLGAGGWFLRRRQIASGGD